MTIHSPELSTITARESAQDWVTCFANAVENGDAADIASLFHPEGFWRDCVAVSGRICTAEGKDQIRSLAAKLCPDNRPRDIRLLSGVKREYGLITGEFSFRTTSYSGTAHFRLLGDQCFLLASFAEDLIAPVETPHTDGVDSHTIIIGAGHAGLSLAARLQHLGIKATIYDAQDRPGDAWRNRYSALTLHDPTPFNHLPYCPFPKSWPDHAPKDRLADFLTDYARNLNLKAVPRTRCTHATFGDGIWTVDLLSEGEARTVTCRNLVIATGKFGTPYLPRFNGLDLFKGSVSHAAGFKDGSGYVGQKVTVIGTGNTGFDVSLDLARHGADVTIVQRSPISLISQRAFSDMLFAQYPDGVGRSGQPNAIERAIHAMPARLYLKSAAIAWQKACETDKDLHTRLTRAGLMLDDGFQGSGVFGQYHVGGTGFVIDQGAGDWIADGRIAMKTGNVTAIDPHGLQLDTGVRVEADAIICATGYQPFNSVLTNLLGVEVARKIGPVWGVGHGGRNDPGPWTGEQRNVWTPTPMPGLWVHGGSLGVSRFYSQLLALQIAASE